MNPYPRSRKLREIIDAGRLHAIREIVDVRQLEGKKDWPLVKKRGRGIARVLLTDLVMQHAPKFMRPNSD